MLKSPFAPVADFDAPQQREMTEQTRRLLEHLQAGNTIHFIQAKDHGITHLAQRILELQAYGVRTYQRQIRMHASPCMEYSLHPFPEQLEHPHEAAAHQMKQQLPAEPPTKKKGKPRKAA